MSSNGEFFFAGLAGKRQEQIQQLNGNINEWQAHCARLERENDELRRSRLFWFNSAVNEGAAAQVYADGFKEYTGRRFQEVYGQEETTRRVNQQKETERKHTFLKYWDPTL